MKHKKLYLTVYSAVFAALICVATMIIYIPIPTGGYAHLGDGLVLLSGLFLPIPYAAIAAGLGSALADIFSGYAIYAPATLIIKALCAVTAALVFRALKKLPLILRTVFSCITAEILMVLGYLVVEAFALGYGAAALGGIFGNTMQGCVGTVGCSVLYLALRKTRLIANHHSSDNES
ncbi:MAG: ECF transporter S component [Ruminococcaceae bacterium]|nr:ECF transporter S component [Oscillospiraceae bacterium]